MKAFTHTQTIRFQHCDPAGIVFYPRYFEMFNLVIEVWFEKVIGLAFRPMHFDLKIGIPTVHIETDFSAPSFLDDVVVFHLTVTHIGNSSARLRIEGKCETQLRCSCDQTIVCVDLLTQKARLWPDSIRSHILNFQEETND